MVQDSRLVGAASAVFWGRRRNSYWAAVPQNFSIEPNVVSGCWGWKSANSVPSGIPLSTSMGSQHVSLLRTVDP